MLESPEDVAVTRVSDPDPSCPAGDRDLGRIRPVLVTMFNQRANSPFFGTKILREARVAPENPGSRR
jgi:hypothetical protein